MIEAARAPYAEFGAWSKFYFVNSISHPTEFGAIAAEFGLAGIGICDTNSLAGVARGHVAAKKFGLPFAVGVLLGLLRQHKRLALDLAGLPKERPRTYEMLRRADSLGVSDVCRQIDWASDIARLQWRQWVSHAREEAGSSDVGDHALIRGLGTASPLMGPKASRSYSGRRRSRPQSVRREFPYRCPAPTLVSLHGGRRMLASAA